MIRRSTLIAVEILLALVAALAIGVGIAWWRLSQGPIELNAMREHVQSELSAARGGRPVGIEGVQLAWSSNGLELLAVGITIEDGRGGVLSELERARIELNVLPLFIGRISLRRAEFTGGAMTFTRKVNGALHIAFGPEGAPADIIIDPPPPSETLEERVARVLDSMEAAFRPVGPGGGLREVSVRGANLLIINDGGGRWTADAANFDLARRGRTLTLAAVARLEGADGMAPASLRITTDTRFRSAVIEFGAENVRPRAVFSQDALGPFGGLDAPMTATISIGLDRNVGVNRFEGDVAFGAGSAAMGDGRFDLEGGRLHGRYDIDSDELIIDEIAFAGDRTRIDGEVRIRDVSRIIRAAPDQPAAFDISLPAMRLAMPGTFSEPVSFSNVRLVGSIVSAEPSIRFTQLTAQTGEGVLHATGRLYWAAAGVGEDRRMRTGLELEGRVDGAVDARVITQVWPMGVGESAREFLARSVQGGRVTDIVARLDIRPSDRVAEAWRNEAVDVRFNVASASMQFVSTMSPVVNARGSGILRGNSFEMTVPEASIHGLAITNGRVEIPQFKPRGAMATISARVDGSARNVLEILAQEPIGLGERMPVDAATATGRANVALRIQRPMVREAPFEAWRFSVDGTIRDFTGNMTDRRISLSQGQLTVRGDQRAVTVSGPVRAGASAIEEVRWTEHIGRNGENGRSEYQVSGDFEADDLERLGYPVAQYAQGRIGVTVTGQGRGFDVDNARIDLDLTNAAVELPRAFWVKRAGVAASARFNVERQSDGSLAFNGIDARGGGLTAQGRMRLARDNRLIDVDLTRLAIEGRSDARLTATRAADGGLDVAVRGALFDGAPFMGGDDAPPEAAAQPANATAPPPQAPLRATVEVDRLKLRGGATLSDARVNLTMLRGALSTLIAEGRSPDNRAFSLALGPRPTDPRGGVRFRSDDAGFAVRALTGMDNVIGGTASADGDWRGGPPSQARFTVRMRDFQVVRLPAMAQLLSSAGSLTGLVDTLNGEGIGFGALDAEMTFANNRIAFSEGRMAGPAMGLTGAGSYDIRRDNLDIDGVIAPSPVLNLSMLGEIPLIGDLLVSRRGEGVFGMTYSINGRAEQPRVGVNPVSALTPGILRRIFEPVQPRESAAPGGSHSWTQEPEAPPPPAEVAPEAVTGTPAEAAPVGDVSSTPPRVAEALAATP